MAITPELNVTRAREQVEALTQAQVRALLQERAARLAEVAPTLAEEEDGETLAVLVCRVGDERYAVEIGTLEAVHPAEGLVPVPCTPRFIAGILNVRGEVVTVMDLAAVLGLQGVSQRASPNGADAAGDTAEDDSRQVLLLQLRRDKDGRGGSVEPGARGPRSQGNGGAGGNSAGELVRLGLLIDEVMTIERVATTALTPALSGHEHARGVATLNGHATVVLDLDRLMAGDRFVVMEEINQ
jgi:chemotaxis signal transduction protein